MNVKMTPFRFISLGVPNEEHDDESQPDKVSCQAVSLLKIFILFLKDKVSEQNQSDEDCPKESTPCFHD